MHNTPSEAGQVKLSPGKGKPHVTCPQGKGLKELMSRPAGYASCHLHELIPFKESIKTIDLTLDGPMYRY